MLAALDELEENYMIEVIMEEPLEGLDADDHEGEEHDHVYPRFDSRSDSKDNRDDEGEYSFSPLPTRNPTRDTVYGPACWSGDAMSDDEMEPRKGNKGPGGRLWAGHGKAIAEHTFETW
eukprot:jgi/Tetstr1/450250/TSEL_037288.t1